jgi:hypothetical protein
MSEEFEPDFETAFIVVKSFDGTFHATQELGSAFTVERLSTRTDMKQGFRDLLDAMVADDLAQRVFNKINENSSEDSQRKVAAIRQSLVNRDIL